MKAFLSILFTSLVACFFLAGCSDDPFEGTGDLPERGIIIQLSTGNLETKTDLTSSANLHNVREVYACLFRGTGDDAVFESCENLHWNPREENNYGEGKIQSYQLELPDEKLVQMTAGTYTVLCVGLDNETNDETKEITGSGPTYGLSEATMSQWKTLADAKAKLAEGKNTTNIAHSELFAGWSAFEFDPDVLNTVSVVMLRRVAGFYAYFKDIPYQITNTEDTYRVTRIKLRLHKPQYTSVSLRRPQPDTNAAVQGADFGESLSSSVDADVLTEIVLKAEDESGCGSSSTDDALWNISEEYTTALGIRANTIFSGVYLLPIEKDGVKPTLTAEVWGCTFTSDGIDETLDYATEKCVKSFPVVNDADNTQQYDMEANKLYHIGYRPNADEDNTDDYPVSLAGSQIKLEVEDWENQDIEVDFPSVPINPTMSYLHGYTERYVFDCVNQYDTLKISPSILKTPWRLQVVGEDGVSTVEWGGLVDGDWDTYTTTRGGTGSEFSEKGATIVFRLADYIEERDYDNYSFVGFDSKKDFILNDIRSAQFRLVPLQKNEQGGDDDYDEIMEKAQYLPIKQYNAITVKFDDNEKVRAFARFNIGVHRDVNGEPINQGGGYEPLPEDYKAYYEDMNVTEIYNDGRGGHYPWGITNCWAGNACRDDGLQNYLNIDEDITEGGAFAVCYRPTIFYNNNTLQNGTTNQIWFFPARDEIGALMELIYRSGFSSEELNLLNVVNDNYNGTIKGYWTSSVNTGLYHTNRAIVTIWKDGKREDVENIYRTSGFFLRRAYSIRGGVIGE